VNKEKVIFLQKEVQNKNL